MHHVRNDDLCVPQGSVTAPIVLPVLVTMIFQVETNLAPSRSAKPYNYHSRPSKCQERPKHDDVLQFRIDRRTLCRQNSFPMKFIDEKDLESKISMVV